MARFLGGSEVGFEIPGVGVFHGPNLTPDKATGLGDWTDAQIVAAIQKGQRPDRDADLLCHEDRAAGRKIGSLQPPGLGCVARGQEFACPSSKS